MERKPSQYGLLRRFVHGLVGGVAGASAASVAQSEPPAAPYDAGLLSKAQLLWREGDWIGLVAMEQASLQHHPERAMLALLIATAHQQMNSPQVAAQFVRLACDWGCSGAQLAQVLIAGVHHTLGRGELLLQNERKACTHFALAAQAGADRSIAGRSRAAIEQDRIARAAAMHPRSAATVAAVPAPPDEPFAPPELFSEGIVSYAQNFEDVMLWRALRRVDNGCYIDVGAFHPVHDSVSRGFYEKGWRGIHVEANPAFAALLREDRPDETVMQVAVAATKGSMRFFEFQDFPSESTGNERHALIRREQGARINELDVPCITLADVFAQAQGREVHWLKIDVERMEREVLAGWGGTLMPWIVVVESALPHSKIENFLEWEYLLTGRGYKNVYFDGLNRYYVSPLHADLGALFLSGPNLFDNFRLSGTGGPYSELVNGRHRQREASLVDEIDRLKEQLAASGPPADR
ncbi:methyltransferase, FkbM family [Pseudoduganella namucuonensis]|uniref:Methyltransferase, FkbM family n=2 Tax=Pseudoduganella namucuonensis TaxID=1035707 RepID=A0A1I7M5K5_9BURK|nr:methyltransferase, FkbM family [Pseudoduganella namucuonensis]